MKPLRIPLLAAAFWAAFSFPAMAQGRCADRALIVQQLAVQYDEHPRGRGVTLGGNVLELFRASDGKTWTLVHTNQFGQTCIAGAGRSWEDLPEPVRGERA